MLNSDRVFEFVEAVEDASSTLDVQRATQDFADELGFISSAYLMHRPPSKAGLKEIDFPHFSTHRRDWLDQYTEQKLWRVDPVFFEVRRMTRPFSWSSISEQRPLSRSERDALAFPSEFGWIDGLTAPVRGPYDAEGALSFALAHDDPVDARQRRRLSQAVAMFAAAVHSRMHALHELESKFKPDATLTPAQKEIIRWLGIGKTAVEIAIILGIREGSVRRHTQEARERLGCATNAQLVVTAHLEGHVTLSL